MFINEAKKVFEMSAAEYKAAMTYGTEAYRALRELRADYPGFRTVEMKPKKSKSPLDKLDMKTVRAYVRAHGSDAQKKDFLDMSTSHYTESGVYIEAKSFFEVKKWFLVEFPEYKDAVDNHEKEMERIFTIRICGLSMDAVIFPVRPFIFQPGMSKGCFTKCMN